MEFHRTKNVVRNIGFGTAFRLVATLGPFLMRTVLLYTLGVDYLGLNSLFTSLLSFLSLAELGVGNAMIYSMYKPVAEDDTDTVCALLNLYKKLYKFIGTIILTVGLILLPFIRYLIKDSELPDDINIYLLYLIYLFNTVISYYLFAYKQSVLQAVQRNDIISKRSMVIQLLMYISQMILLILFHNYYFYIIALPLFTIATNFANTIIVNKLYPQYKCRGEVPKEITQSIKKNVLALMGQKLSNIVLHSSDNIVLSIFLGLTAVAIYGNYYLIINAVVGFTTIIYDSMTAGIGNSIIVESAEKNLNDFRVLSFMNNWIVGWCTVCILCLSQSFMEIWTKKDLMLSDGMVVLFALYFYVYQINKIVLLFKDAAGIWWQDRFRPYTVLVINLVLNILLIQVIGIYGVILSTIISLCVSIPWSTFVMFRNLFNGGLARYFVDFFKGALAVGIICAVTWYCCSLIPLRSYALLIVDFIVCCIVPNVLFVIFSIKNPELKNSVVKFKNMVNRRKK